MSGPLDFLDVVLRCRREPELVAHYNRLTGSSLDTARSPIDAAVDKATGYEDEQVARFAAFVYEFIWCPLVAQTEAGGES